MNPQTWWYLARATGFVAWGLLTVSVVTGLVLSARLARGRPGPAWTLDLHRFLGGTAVVFTALHLAGLVADNYVHFGPADLFVPFASTWKPGAVALGLIALYLLVAIQVTSLFIRRLPRKIWRSVHLTSYAAFWASTFHLQLAGTDAASIAARAAAISAIGLVVFLTLVRILTRRGLPPSARSSPRSRERSAAAASTPTGERSTAIGAS